MKNKIYDFRAKSINGEEISLNDFKGKVMLIVNTASKCGFTPQFKELEDLYRKFKDSGLEILGFPCNQFGKQEPGTSKEIKDFCEINYGVTFKMFEKIDVNGNNAHPLFTFLKDEKHGLIGKDIKWNFTKFLVNEEGEVIARFAPSKSPKKLTSEIEKLLLKGTHG
jgi:glutathione peroxidase